MNCKKKKKILKLKFVFKENAKVVPHTGGAL
jgi:hypothetical protein